MKTCKKNITGLRIVKDSGTAAFKSVKILQSGDAAQYMRQFWSDDIEIYESFFLLLLNRANNTIAYVKISQGGTTSTVVDVKIIAKYVIDSLASSAIVAHNHPSGDLRASKPDVDMTKRLKEVLALVDCQLLDSLIITKEGFFSLADDGQI